MSIPQLNYHTKTGANDLIVTPVWSPSDGLDKHFTNTVIKMIHVALFTYKTTPSGQLHLRTQTATPEDTDSYT